MLLVDWIVRWPSEGLKNGLFHSGLQQQRSSHTVRESQYDVGCWTNRGT